MLSERRKKFLIAVIVFGALLTTAYLLSTSFTSAFNPPVGSGGSGSGAIGVDTRNNLVIGTSTPSVSDSKVLIYATSSNTFILKVVSPTSSPILVVRNDGRVGIATSTPTSTLTVQGDLTVTGVISGLLLGKLNAANIESGVFGTCATCGGGNYSFPASLGVGTTTTVLPQALSVYGGAYVRDNIGIGMGTGSPTTLLDVRKDQNGVTQLYVQNLSTGLDALTQIQIVHNNGSGILQYSPASPPSSYPALYADRFAVISSFGGLSLIAESPGDIRFGTTATERMRIDAAGNVGIGTIAPNYRLHVKSNVSGGGLALQQSAAGADTVISFKNVGGSDEAKILFGSDFRLGFFVGGSGTEKLTIASITGNVGIGKTAPTYRLHVKSDVSGGGLAIEQSAAGADTVISFKNYLIGGDRGKILFAGSGERLGFFAGDGLTENLTILGSGAGTGNVGIGTTGPGQRLDVQSATHNRIRIGSSLASPLLGLELTESGVAKGYIQRESGNKLAFYAGDAVTQDMVILDAGSVGIGTTGPVSRLNVYGVGQATPAVADAGSMGATLWLSDSSQLVNSGGVILFGGNTAPQRFFAGIKGLLQSGSGNSAGDLAILTRGATTDTALTEQMRITYTGNVGIGTVSPAYKLHLGVDSAAKPGTNTWTIFSDARIKKDVRPFSDGLSTVLGINPVWYKYNGKGGFVADGKDYIGVIGQEIANIAPYTVGTYRAKLDPTDVGDTELVNFNSHALTFTLINAVKELNTKIDALRDENEVLKREIDSLKLKLDN